MPAADGSGPAPPSRPVVVAGTATAFALGVLAGVVLAFPTIEAVILAQNVVLAPLGLAAHSYEFDRDRGIATFLGLLGGAFTAAVLFLAALAVRRWLAGPSVTGLLTGYVVVQLYVFHDAIRAAWY